MANKREVAIAILYQDDQFLLQLRDDIPTILLPGHLAFFVGHLESGESPEVAIYRELKEEIAYCAPQLELFERVEMENIIRYVFHGPLVVPITSLQLNEGWDLGLWSIEDIYRGRRYSYKAGMEKPLGGPHQKILLSFLEHRRIKQPS